MPPDAISPGPRIDAWATASFGIVAMSLTTCRIAVWYMFDCHDSDHRVARPCSRPAARRTEGWSVEIALRRQEHERVAHLQDRQRSEDVRHARRERLLGD